MPTRTPTKGRKPAARSTRTRSASPRPVKPVAKRAVRPAARPAPRPASAVKLPGWSDLAAKNAGAVRTKGNRAVKPGLVDGVPTLRFAVLLVAACALFTLYVGHVYATQALVQDVQALRKDNHRLVLKHNRLRGEFDRMTSPAVILDRAAALGLEPSADYAPIIHLDTP